MTRPAPLCSLCASGSAIHFTHASGNHIHPLAGCLAGGIKITVFFVTFRYNSPSRPRRHPSGKVFYA
ncbi:hypothetical protein BN134_2188 [Cronobacter dublinensis 1210]|uniref:Uncharacterized protein n=2 Tax=Cronobacter dublinensis TaxID=413497 RepID=A0A9Q4T1B2_9ENTR|nr:hypothetical protein [Cronobacter dublinensis]EGT5709583.1 hypothetical protein [Cronobacter dublinensis subsp. dublinensis]CCJ81446.1 hypothetical protein BN134_2188 [Cronobacter dublinensis 1210]EGT5734518.1 hypothetical protein [Cronobacter dublinensis subsp. dublinensis]NCH04925.1 hypothetical protein [Cronobacter dublinensis]